MVIDGDGEWGQSDSEDAGTTEGGQRLYLNPDVFSFLRPPYPLMSTITLLSFHPSVPVLLSSLPLFTL